MGRAISGSGISAGGGIKSVQRGEFYLTDGISGNGITIPINRVNTEKCQLKIFLSDEMDNMVVESLTFDSSYELSPRELKIKFQTTVGSGNRYIVNQYPGGTNGTIPITKFRGFRWELIEYA